MNENKQNTYIITAGASYLDIDAYACCVAMQELLEQKREKAIAYSDAPINYSVCRSLIEKSHLVNVLPRDCDPKQARYIIVDVSNPDFFGKYVPLEQVTEVYDHHIGFEEYWTSRIGDGTHIEFVGAAATLIYREWKKAGLQDNMTRSTALLLITAILDNTLNLTSSNTTSDDRETFDELCKREHIDEEWVASYFTEVQANVEADLKRALLNDMKTIVDNDVLPPQMGQLCVWDVQRIMSELDDIRQWMSEVADNWMLNVIDIQHRCSFFICYNVFYQNKIEQIFDIRFKDGIAKLSTPYLRKEILKKIKQKSEK